MEIRVAIFEDNKLVREALETILNGTSGFNCAGAFGDGTSCVDKIRKANPDVVLMDIEMPGPDGIEVTRQLSKEFPDIKIVIQTVFNDSEKIFHALCAGASGYILKNDPPGKYLEAVSEVYNGGAAMNVSVAKKVVSYFNASQFVMPVSGQEDEGLSAREQEILQLMTEGLDFRMIAERMFISYDTVRTHVKHIYKKLHVNSKAAALQKAAHLDVMSKLK